MNKIEYAVKRLLRKQQRTFKLTHVKTCIDFTFSNQSISILFELIEQELRNDNPVIIVKCFSLFLLLAQEGNSARILDYYRPAKYFIPNYFQREISTLSEYLVQKAKSHRNLKNLKDELATCEELLLQIGALVKCNWEVTNFSEIVIIQAYRLLLQEMVVCFMMLNEQMIKILSNYFDMEIGAATRALKIYEEFVESSKKLQKIFENAKRYSAAIQLEIPAFKTPPVHLTNTLRDYLEGDNFDEKRMLHQKRTKELLKSNQKNGNSLNLIDVFDDNDARFKQNEESVIWEENDEFNQKAKGNMDLQFAIEEQLLQTSQLMSSNPFLAPNGPSALSKIVEQPTGASSIASNRFLPPSYRYVDNMQMNSQLGFMPMQATGYSTASPTNPFGMMPVQTTGFSAMNSTNPFGMIPVQTTGFSAANVGNPFGMMPSQMNRISAILPTNNPFPPSSPSVASANFQFTGSMNPTPAPQSGNAWQSPMVSQSTGFSVPMAFQPQAIAPNFTGQTNAMGPGNQFNSPQYGTLSNPFASSQLQNQITNQAGMGMNTPQPVQGISNPTIIGTNASPNPMLAQNHQQNPYLMSSGQKVNIGAGEQPVIDPFKNLVSFPTSNPIQLSGNATDAGTLNPMSPRTKVVANQLTGQNPELKPNPFIGQGAIDGNPFDFRSTEVAQSVVSTVNRNQNPFI